MTAGEQRSELYGAFVGKNKRDYYLERFLSFDDRGGGLIPSWNFAAFFVSGLWALYRKMYTIVLATIGIVIAWEVIAAALRLEGLLYSLFYLILWIAYGVYGNSLYHRHAVKQIAKARPNSGEALATQLQVQSIGGVNRWVLFLPLAIFLAGVIAGIWVPAYQDYTIRAQASIGLDIANDVTAVIEERFDATGELPADNAAAGLPPAERITGSYVRSVAVDKGSVVVTYGNQANAIISGRTIVLTPEIQSEDLQGWTCGSRSLKPQHLPAVCRQR